MSETHSPTPWSIHAEPIANREQALEELTYQLDHTTELASHLYLLNAGGLCPALTGCGPTSKANAEFIVQAVNNHEALLDGIREAYLTFTHYAELHEAKGNAEGNLKAKRNRDLADKFAALIARTTPEKGARDE